MEGFEFSEMEDFHSSISDCNSDQTPAPIMANSAFYPKAKNNRKWYTPPPSSSCSSCHVCDNSLSAAIEIAVVTAVITAYGFLFFPCIKFITLKPLQLLMEILSLLKEEIMKNPMVYGSIALSITCAVISAWVVVLLCTTQRCRNPNCRGLKKAMEFDIQLERDDCMKNSQNNGGLFELLHERHGGLEVELKKLAAPAPENGRDVLIFRAKCGCSVGRLDDKHISSLP